MSILARLFLGLIAGFIASKIVNKTGEGVFLDIVIGIVGAMVGGTLFNTRQASAADGKRHADGMNDGIGAAFPRSVDIVHRCTFPPRHGREGGRPRRSAPVFQADEAAGAKAVGERAAAAIGLPEVQRA